MSVDSERRTVIRLQGELAKLKQDYAKEQAKIAPLQKKIIDAEAAIKRTKSITTIKSKHNETERSRKSIADLSKKCGEIQKKISKKEKDLADAQKRLNSAEVKEAKKAQVESERQMKVINETLQKQSLRQDALQGEIDELRSVPEKITILFLAANPCDTDQLRLDEEARSIQERIRLSEHRDTIDFETRWAVRTGDLLQAINETNPTVIHFSGHGCESGELVLQNPDGTAKLVSPNAISQAISTVSDTVKLVVFNACYSYVQAQSIVEYIDTAIGMSDTIGDDAARIFAAQFYSSLGFGLSVEQSFNQAIAALLIENIPEENIPRLFEHIAVDSKKLYLVAKN